MPSTIVKLCSSDARAWAHNQPLWVKEDGEVARPVTRQEQQAISRALERSRSIVQSFRLSLPLIDVQHPTHVRHRARMPEARALSPSLAPSARLECEFEVSIVGRERVVTVYTGGMRYSTGREVLAARLLADHGECVLHGRNGKCMAVLRDPLIATRAPVQGRRVQFSRNPDDERVANDLAQSVASVNQRVKKQRQHGVVYSPNQCPNDCRGRRGGGEWAIAKNTVPPREDEHHPVCKFAPSWAATLDERPPGHVLYDLELGLVAREAVESEVLEADQVRARTGVGQVTVQGRLYAVLSIEEAEQASREAHGQAEPETAPGQEHEHEPVLTSDDLGELSHESIVAEASPEPVVTPPVEVAALPPVRALPRAVGHGGLVSRAPVSALAARRPPASHGRAAAPAAPARPATAEERAEWPSLDELQPDGFRSRAEVTARDYLARQRRPHAS